jgi:hypothetical protein
MTARTTTRVPHMRRYPAHSVTRAPSDGSTLHAMRTDRFMIPHDTYRPRWASSSRGLCVSRHPLPSLPVAVGELEAGPGKPAVRRSVAVILTAAGMHVKQQVLQRIVYITDRGALSSAMATMVCTDLYRCRQI